ncbi:MAG: tetratricopeptide repeat protein [Nitrospirae bacterium]|nr:MAG: tetratricopeptide repeat protein [Nitrospirota bacterium]
MVRSRQQGLHLCRTGLLAWAFVLSLIPTASAQLGRPEGLYYKSWAVVIGINDYLVAPKLDGAVEDGKAVAEAFRKLGFQEVLEVYNKDASSKRMHLILNEYLPRKVGRHDRVVIFFAGHAGASQDMHNKDIGYLVPWDAQVSNVSKAVTMDHLKEFSRRVMAKHVLFVLDSAVSGWDITPPQPLSLEGRLSPEEDTDKRAVQVLSAARQGGTLSRKNGQGTFVTAFLAGVQGAADENKNGWIMASEIGAYVITQVNRLSGGSQQPQFARLDGEGDTVLVEGKMSAYRAGPEPRTEAERTAAAKEEYDKAFSLLQQQKEKSLEEALERLEKAIRYSPAFGDAYVLKSYLYLDRLNKLDEALSAGELAVKHAPTNPDAHYTLGLVLQKKGRYKDAEKAFLQALAVNPGYSDVHLSLGDLYADDLKDRPKAVASYQRYLETGGNENRVRDYLGKANATDQPTKQ